MNDVFADIVTDLESTLREMLDAEEEQALFEVEYLKNIYEGISDGAALELPSTQSSDLLLVGSLNAYFEE